MKHTYDNVGGAIIATIVIFINAIFDYFNRSTIQAVINACVALLATMLLRRLIVYIRYYSMKSKKSKNT